MSASEKAALSIGRFGCRTFHKEIMKERLSAAVYENIMATKAGKEKINPAHADVIANALKCWAMEQGAVHFCHWFQPLTEKTAEKHDAFFDRKVQGQLIEEFSGKSLLQGEPDASSFPTGGIRETAAARGYTSWDPRSYPFVWKTGNVTTLYIPAVFFSWCGRVIDMKIPLIRAEERISKAAVRLLQFLGLEASTVYSNLGCEQEYFLVTEEDFDLRPDLLLLGRTLFGAPSARGQELSDHYLSPIPERVLEYFKDLEEQAFDLGIVLKTRHREVAPQQFEIAPLFEKTPQAVDHNLLLMQLMRQTAKNHGLECLLHEKPFAGINGSGKHCNWSLQTDSDINLFDPTLMKTHPLVFVSMITAVLSGIYHHASLLRASIGSSGNDHRLGSSEAPPAIISVYLGEELDKFLSIVEKKAEGTYINQSLRDIEIPALPSLTLEIDDRNRTSPFVFTGNKFEFRSVGSSAHTGSAVMVLNAIIAESIHRLVIQMEKEKDKGASAEKAAWKVIQKELKHSKSIRYLGDNYLEKWKKEAHKKGLKNIEKSVDAYPLYAAKEAHAVFEGILSLEERQARVAVLEDNYSCRIIYEAKLMVELFDTLILPACLEYQAFLAESIQSVEQITGGFTSHSKELFKHLSEGIQDVCKQKKTLKKELETAEKLSGRSKASSLSNRVCPQMDALRKGVDLLEVIVQDKLWPFPKYRELLFSL